MVRPNALSLDAWAPLFGQAEAQADTVSTDWPSGRGRSSTISRAHGRAGCRTASSMRISSPTTSSSSGPGVSGLIDFYFACTDALAYDLAICLNAWCFETDGSFNLTKGRAMLAGYEAVRRLEPAEVEALPVLCRGSALRFMLTRLVDWLNVPPGALVKPKDPLEYDRKLNFHRHVACARIRARRVSQEDVS